MSDTPLTITLLDRKTGKTHVEHDKYGNHFMWQMGNYACDCNRGAMFLADDEDDAGYEGCGNERYIVTDVAELEGEEKAYFIRQCNDGYPEVYVDTSLTPLEELRKLEIESYNEFCGYDANRRIYVGEVDVTYNLAVGGYMWNTWKARIDNIIKENEADWLNGEVKIPGGLYADAYVIWEARNNL